MTVNVCHYKPVQRKGTRHRVVCKVVPEQVTTMQTYCEMVPYTATIRVPTYAGAPCGGCATPCGGCY